MFVILFLQPVKAYASEKYLIEVKIETINETRATTKTGKKTVTVKNAAGSKLWDVQVTGTFSYNGSTSTCTNSIANATSYNSNWKIVSKSANKSGNSATATAKANLYSGGAYIDSLTKSVSLFCDKNENLS